MADEKLYGISSDRARAPQPAQANALPPRVMLVAMPWANPEYPSLSLGLLKALLNREGITCDNLYGNQAFLRYLNDWQLYRYMSYAAEGDVVFTPYYFGTEREAAARLIQQRTGKHYTRLGGTEACLGLIEKSESFVEHLYQSVDWSAYDIVGFSLMFQQLLASLSLARRIKADHPGIKILFGGPSCDDTMGLEMVRSFPEVDYVAIGEVDETIVPLVREIHGRATGAASPLRTLGVAYRDAAGEVIFSGRVGTTSRLNELPFPNYDPYFEQLRALQLEGLLQPVLYMEASRGCWWGQKSVCTFCGLNGTTIEFRSKSPERVVEEIKALSGRYHIGRFWTSDNILDHKAYKTLLPALKNLREQEGYDLSFFFEIKSNVTKQQVKALRDAGITWVQPGIESFSDHVLALMHKGAEGIQQIQLLKFLAEYSMDVDWNILYANPNELPADYYEMAELIPFMHHLPPPAPGTVIQMNLQRFTRYHKNPEEHGITSVRPGSFYSEVFPRADIDLSRLVYFFEYEHPDQQDEALQAAHKAFIDAVERWRSLYRPHALTYRRGPGYLRITDLRASDAPDAPARSAAQITLSGLQAEIYLFCDSAKSAPQVFKEFAGRAAEGVIAEFLALMVSRRLMFRSATGKYLSMALQDHGGRGLHVQDAVAVAFEALNQKGAWHPPTAAERQGVAQ